MILKYRVNFVQKYIIMKQLLVFSFALLLLFSCNNQSTDNNEGEEKKSETDILFSQVMEGHDAAMPKMNKLARLQRETKAAIDSLSQLPAAAKKNATAYKTRLDSLLKDLEYADFAMNKWMQEFKYDSLKNNEVERIKYLQSEKEKVNKMKDAVLGSIQKADSIFAAKK